MTERTVQGMCIMYFHSLNFHLTTSFAFAKKEIINK